MPVINVCCLPAVEVFRRFTRHPLSWFVLLLLKNTKGVADVEWDHENILVAFKA